MSLATSDERAGAGGVVNPSWPWWSGVLALALGLVAAVIGELIIYIPAIAAGANAQHPSAGIELASTVVQDGCFVGAAVWCAWRLGGAATSWGFGLRPTNVRRAVLLVIALLVAFFAFNAAWGALLNLGSDKQLLNQLGVKRAASLKAGAAILVCVIAPMCEETLFRGYMFTALRNWRGLWPAVLITGVIFGLVHGASSPAGDLLPLALLGAGLCLLYWRTGSLYPGIAAHSINNSIAFGVGVGWSWQIPLLTGGSLAAIAAAALMLRRAGVIAPGERLAPA
ncbi:MAG TPA: CPBP family intramembrane glutamic endopeptidase [Solirubrobacteraceae bacterium]|jgi:hypothetical protein|nr:CPBP family intramembrane glutamic endopeptidase [Solirubrobacteraceae bacterium]